MTNLGRAKKSPLRKAALTTVLLSASASIAQAQVKAFPEAEGFGAAATGGRGGAVYHVTNLNDTGAGSFRDAVSQPNRIVVFDVGGWVELQSVVGVKSNITIAGQTAPGQGIGFKNYGVSFSNASNVIARNFRVRQGPYVDSVGQDATGGTAMTNMVFDHISATWGRDENFSVESSTNVTVQNSIIGEGMLNHSMGSLMEWNTGLSVHHSLYIDNNDRNPKTKGIMDFVNNVVYNWASYAYVAGDSAGLSYGNVVGNYFVAGPSSSELHDPISRGNHNYSMYFAGNYYDGNQNGVLDGHPETQADVDDDLNYQATRFPYPQVTTDAAPDAFESVLNHVGPSINRDSVDARLINQVRTQTGGLISDPAQVGGWGTLAGGVAPTDTDQDGMPDAWETAHGLNPNDASDRNNLNLFGYTRVEEYLNELGGAHTAKLWRSNGGGWLTAAKWADGVIPTYDDTVFVQSDGAGNNGVVNVDAPGPTAWDVRVGGNGAVTAEQLNFVAGGSLTIRNNLTIGYEAPGTVVMQGGELNAQHIVLGSFSYSGNLQLNAGVVRTTMVAPDGAGGTITFNGGTLAASGAMTVTAPITIGAGGGTIDTNGFDSTISSVITGSALTKTGAGNLDLTNTNTLAGVILKGGTLSISSNANIGGAASPITFQGGSLRVLGTTLTNINSHAVNWTTLDGGIDVADATNTFTISSQITGSGAFTKAGAGKLVLTNAANSFTGGTTVAGGILSVQAHGVLGQASAPIHLAGGTLQFTGTGTLPPIARPISLAGASSIDVYAATETITLSQPITGDGSLSMTGPGVLVLSSANTYTGDTIIANGQLRITDPKALQYSTVTTRLLPGPFPDSSLVLNGLAAFIGGLAGDGGINLEGAKLTLGGSNRDSTFAGFIGSSGAGGSIEKIGTGTINFTGTNTYTAGTTLTNGAIGITTDSNIGGASSAITFNGGLLRINGTTLKNMGSHVVNWSTFNGGFDIDSASNAFTVSQSISGSGSLTKKGAGTLVLNGTNSYAGGTILQGGELQISNLSNVGTSAAKFTFAGGILKVSGTGVTNLNTATTNWSTFNGGFDVVTSGVTFTVPQVIGGAGSLTKLGAGVLQLQAANTFTGNTNLNGGTLQVTNADSLRNSTLIPGGGTLSVSVTNFANVGGISGSGAFAFGGFGINVGYNNLDTTYSGVISQGTNGPGLTKVGIGTLTLSGASTHTQAVTIKQGVVSVASMPNYGSNGPLGAGTTASNLVLDGGTLQYNSGSTATSNRLFTLTQNGGEVECAGAGALTLSATTAIAMSGTGDRTLTMAGVNADCGFSFLLGDPTTGKTMLHKIDGGRWIMNGAAGSLTYSGDTVIDAGILIINGNVRLPFGAGKGNLVINAGQFEMNGRDCSINGLYGAGNIQNRTATHTLTLGNADASGDFSGVVSNTGGGGSTQLLNVTKVGTGTQIFSGFNTYGGATTVQAGTLVMASHGAAGFSSLNVTGGTLRVDPGADEALPIFKSISIGGTTAAPTGTIDIASGGMLASKSAGNALATLSAWTFAGVTANTGKGITSAWLATHPNQTIAVVDNANLGLASFHGLAVTADSLIVAPAVIGDANLDGTVEFADLLKLSQNYGTSGGGWTAGDFNNDGNINFTDLLALSQHYGESDSGTLASWAFSQVSVPEPVSLGWVWGCAVLLKRRARI